MPTALFVIFSAYGHLNPCLKVAQNLQNIGYRCVFAVSLSFQELIHNNGFEAVVLQSQPFGVGLENWKDINVRRPYLENLLDRFQHLSYNSRQKDYQRWLDSYSPAVIFIDAFCSTDVVVIEPLIRQSFVKIILLQTMLSPYNDGITPPLNTFLMPNNPTNVRWAWQQVKIKRFFTRLKDFVLFLGKSNTRLVKQKMKENNLPSSYILDFNKVFHVGFQNIDEWVLAPAEFEFMNKPPKNKQHYIGLMIAKQPTILPQAITDFIDNARSQQKKIIYASLGTLHEIHTKGKAKDFFKKLIEVFEQNPTHCLLLSVGTKLYKTLKTNASNIKIADSVPQRSILGASDVFITHGGLNSILESIYAGTPMIVVPLNQDWDQNGNAARIVYHKLGIKIDLKSSKKVLNKAIMSILADNSYQQQTNAFRIELTTTYHDNSIQQTIEKLLDT